MGRMTWDLATLQYYCWAGRAGRKAYSDYAVDRLGRQPPTRTTAPTRHGGRRGPVVWPVKYYLGGAGTPESTGVMSRLPETVPRLSLSRNFTADVVCNGGDTARAAARNSGPPTGLDWSGPTTPPAAARTTRMSRPVLTDLLIQPPAHVP
jgi:hypothetical protein